MILRGKCPVLHTTCFTCNPGKPSIKGRSRPLRVPHFLLFFSFSLLQGLAFPVLLYGIPPRKCFFESFVVEYATKADRNMIGCTAQPSSGLSHGWWTAMTTLQSALMPSLIRPTMADVCRRKSTGAKSNEYAHGSVSGDCIVIFDKWFSWIESRPVRMSTHSLETLTRAILGNSPDRNTPTAGHVPDECH